MGFGFKSAGENAANTNSNQSIFGLNNNKNNSQMSFGSTNNVNTFGNQSNNANPFQFGNNPMFGTALNSQVNNTPSPFDSKKVLTKDHD